MSKRGKKKNQTQLIIQALTAAEASINLAKQLLSSYTGVSVPEVGPPAGPQTASTRAIPGIVGKFDGEFMATKEGKKYSVPANYASKSKMVYGDTLKMIKNPDGSQIFKQIERVKRARVSGILAKKDGKWCAVTADGSYRVLPASVAFFSAQEGDEAQVLIPLENRQAPFAAIESIPSREMEKEKRGKPGKVEEDEGKREGRKKEERVGKEKKVEGKEEKPKATRKAATPREPAAKKTAKKKEAKEEKKVEKKEVKTTKKETKEKKKEEVVDEEELR